MRELNGKERKAARRAARSPATLFSSKYNAPGNGSLLLLWQKERPMVVKPTGLKVSWVGYDHARA